MSAPQLNTIGDQNAGWPVPSQESGILLSFVVPSCGPSPEATRADAVHRQASASGSSKASPSNSDSLRTICEWPTFIIGNDERDVRLGFSPTNGVREVCATDPWWLRTAQWQRFRSTTTPVGTSSGRAAGREMASATWMVPVLGRRRRHALGGRRKGDWAVQPLHLAGQVGAAGERVLGIPERSVKGASSTTATSCIRGRSAPADRIPPPQTLCSCRIPTLKATLSVHLPGCPTGPAGPSRRPRTSDSTPSSSRSPWPTPRVSPSLGGSNRVSKQAR